MNISLRRLYTRVERPFIFKPSVDVSRIPSIRKRNLRFICALMIRCTDQHLRTQIPPLEVVVVNTPCSTLVF